MARYMKEIEVDIHNAEKEIMDILHTIEKKWDVDITEIELRTGVRLIINKRESAITENGRGS